MGLLILLVRSLLPLAVLAVAVIHGLSTRDGGTVAALGISAVILIASALLPFMDEPEPVPSVRFNSPEAGAVATKEPGDHPLRLARRWVQDEIYRQANQ